MAFGLTENGFVRKTLLDVKADLQAEYRTIYGNPNLADDSVIGIRIGIMAKQLADAWETLEGTYNAPFPSKADAGSIPDVMDEVGLRMLPAIKTMVVCVCGGTVGTVIPAGSLAANTNGDIFESVALTTIGSGGTSSVTFRAMVAGPVAAPAGTVTGIQTPISGWTSIANAADGVIGRIAETVAEARIRRRSDLQVIGASTIDAIVARVRNEVADVIKVEGFTNRTDVADASGRPPHSNEIVVVGGTDQDIADKIWQCTSGGIRMYGNTTVSVVDSTGKLQSVSFTRELVRYVHLEITVISYYSEEALPLTGENLRATIRAALIVFGATLPLGKDLIIQRWYGPVLSIPGIGSISIRHAVTSDPHTSPAWSTANVAIGETSRAEMSDSGAAARITVILP
jgi:uncharacterized phage protein gp47/JayE